MNVDNSQIEVAGWNLAADGIASDPLADLEQHGITGILLNGPALLGTTTTRTPIDVDLLVEREALPVVGRLLTERGYRRTVDVTPMIEPEGAENWKRAKMSATTSQERERDG